MIDRNELCPNRGYIERKIRAKAAAQLGVGFSPCSGPASDTEACCRSRAAAYFFRLIIDMETHLQTASGLGPFRRPWHMAGDARQIGIRPWWSHREAVTGPAPGLQRQAPEPIPLTVRRPGPGSASRLPLRRSQHAVEVAAGPLPHQPSVDERREFRIARQQVGLLQPGERCGDMHGA